MRRAVLTLGGTAAALAALFSFRTHVPGVEAAATGPAMPAGPSVSAAPAATPDGSASASASGHASPRASASATASPTSSASSLQPPKSPVSTPTTQAPTQSADTPTRAPSSSAPPTSAPPTTAPPTPTTRTVTGAEEQTQYGPVQVTITVSGSKVTAASGSTLGQGDQIGQGALPQLNSEAVTAGNASIQAVSGATYTSNGYIQSLQSAVDQAGI
jgi:uncharacterized protein with FMN-binding domain